MKNYEIFNLNDLRQAYAELKLFYNNQANIQEANVINITLNMENIEAIQPLHLDAVQANITEEYHYGMLYTMKLILASIYKLVNDNLTITLSCHLFYNFSFKKNKQIKEKIIKFINIIKELQQESNIHPHKFFWKIKNPYDLEAFKETVFLLNNKTFQEFKVGGLILEEVFICTIIPIIGKKYLEQLINLDMLNKIRYIEINFINLNNYENLFNYYSEYNEIETILEKEKFQLLKLFTMLKKLIDKHSNLIKFNMNFFQYNSNNLVEFQKTFNLLPIEYHCLQSVYNDLIQNSVARNIKNKLEKYLFKINNLENSIENLNQICTQENVMYNKTLSDKLQQNICEMLTKRENVTEKFFEYTTVLNQANDPSVFYYLAKFYQHKKEFKKAYEYLELVDQKSTSFNVTNNLKFFLYLKNYATHLEDYSSQITDSAENKMLVCSKLKHHPPQSASPTFNFFA